MAGSRRKLSSAVALQNLEKTIVYHNAMKMRDEILMEKERRLDGSVHEKKVEVDKSEVTERGWCTWQTFAVLDILGNSIVELDVSIPVEEAQTIQRKVWNLKKAKWHALKQELS